MNDDPVLAALTHRLTEARDALADEHMSIPASEILARGRRRRARDWLMAAAAACAAAGLAVSLTLAAGSHAPGNPAQPGPARLAAWTVVTNPDGTVTFTLRNTSHPVQLEHALARAGVPAVVRWGKICQAGGLMNTETFVKGSSAPGLAGGTTAWFAVQGGSDPEANLDLGWSWTVIPSKIPHSGHFVISAVPGSIPASDIQALWEFARTSAPVTCARLMKP